VEGGTGSLSSWTNSGFSYKDSSGNVTNLTGIAVSSTNSCTGNETAADKLLTSKMLDLKYDTYNSADGEVAGFQPHGYINPKYVILGVAYAPPGHSSYATYTNNSTISSTGDIKSTFSSAYQTSLKTSITGTIIKGWSAGTSSTSTTAYTQSSYTSTSNTVSRSTSLSDTIRGPSNDSVGLNHDYDVVWVWLNPVQNFRLIEDTAYSIQNVQWDGSGYSTLDPVNAMDVIALSVGELNGDLPMSAGNANAIKRTWAASEVWPSGGPGLTSADLQAIAKANPFWQCKPNPAACPTSPDSVRYTLTLNQDMIYQQAPPGGQPLTQTYTDSYTQASTVGHGASYTHSQTYATETTYSGSLFFVDFSRTVGQSSTFSTQLQWDRSLTTSNTQTGTVSITGPTCTGNPCNPSLCKVDPVRCVRR